MSDSEPIQFRQRVEWPSPAGVALEAAEASRSITAFNRSELSAIMDLYGRKVASGAWRDYAIDQMRDKAVFSVFRRASEVPLYRIEKDPRLARKQGAYAVVAAGGRIVKRGHDLRRVLGALEDRLHVVSS